MKSEKHEIPGQWWAPSNPEEKWLGTLSWKSSEGPRLKVTVPKAFFPLSMPQAPPILHGVDEHGKPVTLLFPGRPRSHGAAVLSELEFYVGYAVLGFQFPNRDAFLIHSLTLQVQHLYEWGGITGFINREPSPLETVAVHFQLPEAKSFTINSDLRLELHLGLSFKDGYCKKNIHERLFITFHSADGLDFSKTIELLNAIRHLLHFAVLERVYPLEITAGRRDSGRTTDGHFFPNEIKIWNSIIREPVESELWAERWVFQFKDLQANFDVFFRKWVDYLETFGEAIGCYFTSIYHRLPYSVEFLCLTQALEAYHGVKFCSHEQKDFKVKVLQLAEANRSNLIGLVDDPAEFATTVQHNRNHYTHYNPKWQQDGRVVSGAKLHRLNEKLRLLFQMCVLTDMEIPQARFARLRRQIATEIIEYI